MPNRDTGLWSKLQERLKDEPKAKPTAKGNEDITRRVRKMAKQMREAQADRKGSIARPSATAGRTARAAPARADAKSARRATPKKATRAGIKTRKKMSNAAYKRELKTRHDDGIRAEIDQRVDEASRIREQIMAKIERRLAEDDRDRRDRNRR